MQDPLPRGQVYAPVMVRFLVLYQPPTDPEAFEKHYFDVHVRPSRRSRSRSA
jgi:hypothetical protein